jgi:hypothetical protein
MYVPLATFRTLYTGENLPVGFIAVKGPRPGPQGWHFRSHEIRSLSRFFRAAVPPAGIALR